MQTREAKDGEILTLIEAVIKMARDGIKEKDLGKVDMRTVVTSHFPTRPLQSLSLAILNLRTLN